MNYIIAPSNDDILHYAKGSESKGHKYISRVFSKGRWVYTYAKNRLRGNKVTNKDAKKKGKYGEKLQYSPTNKTPSFTNQYGKDKLKELNQREKDRPFLGEVYEPNVLSITIGRDSKGNFIDSNYERYTDKHGKTYLREMHNDHNKQAYEEVNRARDIAEKRYTNKGQPNIQYTPQNRAINIASRGTPYSPQNRAINTASRGTAYTPQNRAVNTASRGTAYTPSSVKSTKTTARAPMSVMGYSHVNVGGGSHSFDKDFTDTSYEYGKSVFDKTIEKLSNASKERERKKEEKKRKILSNKNKEPEKILGSYSSSGQKKRAIYLSKGSHKF